MKINKVVHTLIAIVATGTLTLGGVSALAGAESKGVVTSCTGVWVVVDSGQGKPTVQCATSFTTGLTALKSAGFSVKEKTPGFICQINAFPLECTAGKDGYWSYWHATQKADGSWSAWSYDTKGAAIYSPKKGDAEGWRYTKNDSTTPGVKPAKGYSKNPAPKILGQATVGKTLSAKARFSPKPKYSYQWLRNGKKISGATKSTYKLRAADKGKTIKVTVTATKAGYQQVTQTSKTTKKVK